MRPSFLRPDGYTLIELMVVVLIIAILIVVAVPVYNVARARVRRRACQANLRIVNGAMVLYYVNEEGLPPVSDGCDISDLEPYLVPRYVREITACPSRGHYIYRSHLPPYIECDSTDGGKHEVPAVD